MSLGQTRRGARSAARRGAAVVVAGPKPTVPATGALFGLVSENTAQTHAQSWAADVTTLGRTPDYQSFYYHTSDAFPVADTTASTPVPNNLMVTWFGWPDSEVNSGARDAAITTRAQALAALGKPVFLRWDIEMNIESYGYESTPAYAAANGPTFIAAWQRVYGLFQAAGATNVAFVWCPNSNGPGDPNGWRPFYPGDAYVDWVAVDAYNFGNSASPAGSVWQTYYQVLNAFVTDYKANFGGAMVTPKPLMVGEGGSVEGGGSKTWWLTDMSGYLRTNGFKALTYYNTNQSSTGNNYRFDSSTNAAQAFKEIAQHPYFGGTDTKGSGYAAAVLTDTPRNYWKLAETTGNFADSGSANESATPNGTFTRACFSAHGGLGGAVSTYGSGYVTLGTLGSFGSTNIANGFTIEFWYKHGGGTAATCIVGQLNTGSTTGLAVYANQSHSGNAAGTTYFWLRNEAGVQRYSDVTGVIYDGLWHHIVWVCQPGTTVNDTIYIDGVTVTPAAQTKPAAGTFANLAFPLFLGGRNNRGSIDQTTTGIVGDLAIYTTALSSTRVTAHYAAGTT